MKVGIVAFAFGVPATVRPNREIARIARDASRKLRAPIYTQRDIPIGDGYDVTYEFEDDSGNPPSTLRIARGAARWATRRGIKKIWVVAAMPHMPRAMRDIKYAFGENSGVRVSTVIYSASDPTRPEGFWFHRRSRQCRTRCQALWRARERMLMSLPLPLYRIVAH